MNVLRSRSGRQRTTSSLRRLQQPQPLRDRPIRRIQLGSSRIRINRIRNLIIAALIKRAQVKPDFRDVGIDTDSSGISIQRISELVDLEVEHPNRAPERRVPSIPIDSLLVRLVCLVVFLPSHIRPSEQIPALRIRWVRFERFGEVLNRQFLILERRPVLMIQPSKLLKDLGMRRIISDDSLVRILRPRMVLLLFVHVSNLEPNIRMCEWRRWVPKDPIKTPERILEFALLLVDYPKSEQDLVLLVEIQILAHPQDRRERFFGMVQRSITIVQYPNSVPEFRILLESFSMSLPSCKKTNLGIGKKVERLLVSRVGFLKIVLHEITVSQRTPNLPILLLDSQHPLEEIDSLGIVLLDPRYARHLRKP